MGSKAFSLGEDRLTPARLVELASRPSPQVTVSAKSWERLEIFRGIVDEAIEKNETIYGINTGFGFLSDVKIDNAKLGQLQLNLVRSHACGVGEHLPLEQVRALLILRAHTFLLGHSGVTRSTVEKILEFLSHDILPVIPSQGSVGASGDLAPLAHLALGLIGEGDVLVDGDCLLAREALKRLKVKPLTLHPKEGLSLINGTQFMAVISAFAVETARTLAKSADIFAAMSLDAIRGTLRAFDDRIHSIRKQSGQSVVATNIRRLFEGGDGIVKSHAECRKVQDPYSFRCVPQVHGATRDAVRYVADIVERELNSVTDNPLVFEGGDVISGGNFHGQPLALAMDFLGIAVAEIGSIAERRIEKLTNPNLSGLPAFVTRNSGLNSGFMIPHVVAAALVSENKVLAHPASVDSIPTSADKEDHVSMGPIAARKAITICRHVRDILAIEALTAAQGLDLLKPLKPSRALGEVHAAIRELSPPMDDDRSLHKDIGLVGAWITAGKAITSTGIHLD